MQYPKHATEAQLERFQERLANARAFTGLEKKKKKEKIVKSPIGNIRYVGAPVNTVGQISEDRKAIQLSLPRIDWEVLDQLNNAYQDLELEDKRVKLDSLLLQSALRKISDLHSGINTVFRKRKRLSQGSKSTTPTLEDYLKLGMAVGNLTDAEREVVLDLLKKSLPQLVQPKSEE